MKRSLLAFSLIAASTSLSAATITPSVDSNVVLGLVTDFSTTFVWDIRGVALFEVTPPGGSVAAFDSVGGTDMSYTGALAFGNDFLYLQSGSEFGVLAFDFSAPVLSATEAFLTAFGVPLGIVTEPALASLIGSSPYTASFAYTGLTPIDDSFSLVTWKLTGLGSASAVPEPATGLLAAATGVAFLLFRRRLAR